MVTPYSRCINNAEPACETTCCTGDTTWCGPWIGSNYNQYNLVSGQPNSTPTRIWSGSQFITPVNCHSQGARSVAAIRFWHGAFGFLSEAMNANVTNCYTCDTCPENIVQYAQYNPDQIKYLTATYNYTYDSENEATGVYQSLTAGAVGSRTVNAQSGEITSTLITQETGYGKPYEDTDGTFHYWIQYYSNGGAGYSVMEYGDTPVTFTNGGTTVVDNDISAEPYGYADLAGAQDLLGELNYMLEVAGISQINFNTIATQNGWSVSQTFSYPDSYYHNSQTVNISVTRTNTGYTCNIYTDFISDSAPGSDEYTNDTMTYNLNVSLSNPNPFSTLVTDYNNLLSNWPLNNDSLWDNTWDTSGHTQIAPLMSRNETSQQQPLGFNPYTLNDFRSPIASGSSYNGYGYGQTPWFDPAVWSFWWDDSNTSRAADDLVRTIDGSILGSPISSGSNGDKVQYWMYNYMNWGGCHYNDPDSGTNQFIWWQNKAGAAASWPSTATQMTDNYFSIGTPPQASIMYADLTSINQNDYCNSPSCLANTGRALITYKYAEILERWPSQNFFRPAGNDKFLTDEPNVVCISGSVSISGSGQSFTVMTNNGSLTTLSGSGVGIWGGPNTNGYYLVTVAGHIVTLGVKQFNLPSNITAAIDPDTGDGDTYFGALRFPTYPSLIGRQTFGVLYTQPSGSHSGSYTGSFSNAQPAFGMSCLTTPSGSENVDLYDWRMSVTHNNLTVTRIDDSNFGLPYISSIQSGSAYSGSVYIMNHGAPGWYWNDQFPKGDFIRTELLFDNRTNGESARLSAPDCFGNSYITRSTNLGYAAFTQSQESLALSPCCGPVMCYSPNGETWPNGKTYPFPTFTADQTYGSRWQGNFTQVMDDPLYQSPHTPCGYDGGWFEDDGTCMEDDPLGQYKYYAMTPQVAARVNVPSGSPALPVGYNITLGYANPVYSTASNAFAPQLYIGFDEFGDPVAWYSPWEMLNTVCDSVNSDCRFPYDQYGYPCES
jgi:hypothetical protein